MYKNVRSVGSGSYRLEKKRTLSLNVKHGRAEESAKEKVANQLIIFICNNNIGEKDSS